MIYNFVLLVGLIFFLQMIMLYILLIRFGVGRVEICRIIGIVLDSKQQPQRVYNGYKW
jgi:hypothetical protein